MSSCNVYDVLDQAAQKWSDLPALYQPIPSKGGPQYAVTTWTEFRVAVQEIAAGLSALGVQYGDIVALHSETRAEFYLCDFGVMASGATAAALYTSYPVRDQVKKLRTLGCRVVFLENPKTLAAFQAEAKDGLDVRWVIMNGATEGALSLAALRERGRAAMAADPGLFSRLQEQITPPSYAMLYMTSGATGEPKMGLVTHGAITSNIDAARQVLTLTPEDRAVIFLPSAHITQRLALEVLPVLYGMPLWFSEGLSKLPHELKRIRPTFLVAPPRLWERIHASISTEVRKRPALVQKLFHGALGAGLQIARLEQSGAAVPSWLQAARRLGDRLVLRKIRERFGGAVRIAVSGGAPLGRDLALFYAAINMPITEGYGLTEGGITHLNPIGKPRIGSIGKALPTAEAKLGPDGELLLRGPMLFAGYYQDSTATNQVLQDGWLHTGDVAEIDNDGFVFITGRKKEVIVASNGKKVYPARIEALFKLEPLISQILLVGDKMPYVSALFTLNPAVVETLEGMESYRGRSTQEIVSAPPVLAAVKQIVAKVNRQLAPFEQVRQFRILERDFSIDAGEMTPTMKVRRSQVLENYRTLVNELYAGKEELV